MMLTAAIGWSIGLDMMASISVPILKARATTIPECIEL